MTIKLVTVSFAIDASAAQQGHEEAFVADCVNESFREMQRSFNPQSPILDYAIDGVRPSSASVAGYEEGDAFSFMDECLPTAVLEVEGSVINCIRSNMQMRVVILDSDTEGGDEDNVMEVNGEEAYLTDRILTGQAGPGHEGVDSEFVNDVLSQLSSDTSEPDFLVHFEAIGFTNSHRVLDAEISQAEAEGFTSVVKAEGLLPRHVVGLVGGYITPDDGQGRRDIKVFCRIKLRVRARSESRAEMMAPPRDLLTRIADMMVTFKGRCLVDLQSNWHVVDVERV